MTIAWFLCPYKRSPQAGRAIRYCAMDDFTEQIYGEGGQWAETEVLGNRAVVKVRASRATLDTINATPTFREMPVPGLVDPLLDVLGLILTGMRQELLDAGYSEQEVGQAMPDLTQELLGDYLSFFATRRLKPRYDSNADQIRLDGAIQTPRTVGSVDDEVKE